LRLEPTLVNKKLWIDAHTYSNPNINFLNHKNGGISYFKVWIFPNPDNRGYKELAILLESLSEERRKELLEGSWDFLRDRKEER
jgi:hypothetical protein